MRLICNVMPVMWAQIQMYGLFASELKCRGIMLQKNKHIVNKDSLRLQALPPFGGVLYA